MARTYEPIATTTLGSAAATVTFSSIPATYTDLVLIMSAKITSGGATNDRIQFNGDTSSNYSTTVLYGSGSAAGSYRLSSTSILIDDVTSTNFNANIINIMNYANTTTYKTVILRSSPPDSSVQANVGLWRKTPEAINQVSVLAGSSTFVAGSTFTLYGIKAA